MNLREKFEDVFHQPAQSEYFAPGRINLIGEHIDYNGGNVFPCAITYGTTALFRKRNDSKIRFYSENFSELGIIECDLDHLEFAEEDAWANYPKGVLNILDKDKHVINSGFDVLYYGNIPNGAGLSSSASLTVVTTVALNDLYDLNIEKIDTVFITQRVENEFMGVNTGIMDQFAITFGQENHAMLLNTNTVEYEDVPIDLGHHSIIIMNTNKRRGLTDSKYNERRAECDQALAIINQEHQADYLCDLNVEQLQKLKHLFDEDETLYRRAFHAVSENQRTMAAKNVLEKADLLSFGQLLNASHKSLRDDYEVTGVELDTLVERAWKHKACVGARVTGAGFGGCAIAIVHNNSLDEFIQDVGDYYLKEIGYAADFYIAQVGKGAQKVK